MDNKNQQNNNNNNQQSSLPLSQASRLLTVLSTRRLQWTALRTVGRSFGTSPCLT